MKATNTERATLKACTCNRCGTGFTILTTGGWRPSNPLCDDCDFADATDEFLAEREESARRERIYG